MTVTIIKPKATDVTKIDSEQVIPAEVVDEFAMLKAEVTVIEDDLKPMLNKVKQMEQGIIGAVDEVISPGTPFTLVGNEFELQLGAQGTRTVISDSEAVVDELGIELFLKLAKVSITDLRAYCTPEQLEKITKTTFATKRRVKVEKL